jgi:cell division protein FtsB
MTTERRHEKSRSKVRMFIWVNVVLFLFLGLGFGREYLRNLEIEQEIARMQDENARLEDERLQSMQLIDELSSTYYLESEARKKRGMGKDGETLVVVQGVDTTDEDTTEIQTGDDVPNSLRWFYYFFDRPRFDALREV